MGVELRCWQKQDACGTVIDKETLKVLNGTEFKGDELLKRIFKDIEEEFENISIFCFLQYI